MPFSFLEPCTKDYHRCHEKDAYKLESRCGKEEEDQFIIAWRAKPSKEHFCFVVNENEKACVFEGGKLIGVISEAGSYKFERKSGVSIMWVWKEDFQMEYGVPKSTNVVSKDNKPVGFHGKTLLFVQDVEKFVKQFSRQEKVTTCTLRELILGGIIDAFRKVIRNMDKKEFMGKRSDDVFLKEIVVKLYPLFEAYGIEIMDITIEGFASDC